MPKFTFDAQILCRFEIDAEDEEAAIAMLESADMETGNLGCLPDGSPIIATLDAIDDASGGSWSAALIDGKER